MFPRLCCCCRVIVPFCWSCDNLLSLQSVFCLLLHRENWSEKAHTRVRGKGQGMCPLWGVGQHPTNGSPSSGGTLFMYAVHHIRRKPNESTPNKHWERRRPRRRLRLRYAVPCGVWGDTPRRFPLIIDAKYLRHNKKLRQINCRSCG